MFTRLAVLSTAVLALGIAEAGATYSVVALDPATGQLGVAVQSNTISVGARVRWGQAGVAAIASQASSNPMMGEIGVLLIQRGFSAVEARDMIVAMDKGIDSRQFAIVDFKGGSAGWTGAGNSGWAGHICQPNFCVEANTMTGPEVVNNMAIAYAKAEKAGLPLAERLLNVLDAAEAAGGDRRGTQSAGLMIFEKRAIADYGDHALDLRVDESDNPLKELRRIYNANIAGGPTAKLADLIKAKNWEEALASIDASLKLDPGRDAAYVQKAQVYLAMSDTPAAVKALAEAIKLNPKTYNQILRNDTFKPIWENASYRALGDYAKFAELKPSMPGKDSMPMPAIP
jgi:uncharacterized Ntn-hydrolase superfamily protein